MKVTGIIALAAAAAGAVAHRLDAFDSIIERVNGAQTLWRAGRNNITSMPAEQRRGLLGALAGVPEGDEPLEEAVFTDAQLAAAPESFDARRQWGQCSTISHIRNQKQCGSCWAFAAVEAMSDRECIFNQISVDLSAEDMNSCCQNTVKGCGSCDGGYAARAWQYWVKVGVVSDRCYPYTAGQSSSQPTPKCQSKCTGSASMDWSKDKYKGATSYSVTGEKKMMTELSSYGPFEVRFDVYEDFYSYSSGIYKHVTGKFEGGHCVKLVGYGTENGVKYWILANSWDTTWGEKGFFRMVRGANNCGIEAGGVSGKPAARK